MGKLLEIIGPYPPPLGGISVHISRLETYLQRAGISYRIFNHGYSSTANVVATKKSYWWYIKYLFGKKGSLVHFHQFSPFHYFYFYIFSIFCSTRFIATIHEENLLNYNKLLRRVIIFLLRRTDFDVLISVSVRLTEFLKSNRIDVICLPAYVPANDVETIPLVHSDTREYFLFSVWKMDPSIATSIYNTDLAFKACCELKDKYKMLFLIGTEVESDKKYLMDRLSHFGIANSVTLIFGAELIRYLPNCKFLLRTNRVDGYGVSLQEALDMKIPAIATDVCIRPKGTILFRGGDLDDLLDKINNIEKYWDLAKVEFPSYHLQLIELYQEQLG